MAVEVEDVLRAGRPRIAIVSIGIGRVQRGFERYFYDLFLAVRDKVDITLYKSAGAPAAQEKIPSLLWPATRMARALPLDRWMGGTDYQEYKRDCLAFGFCLLPELLRQRFDVIHVIDPPLAQVLQYLLRACHLRTRLLLCDGCLIPPRFYPSAAHVQITSHAHLQNVLAMGVPASQVTALPPGVHTQRFVSPLSRQELRRKYGTAEDTFVILAVSALRLPKRIDYIIEEVSRLTGDVLFWLDGYPEDPSIPALARDKLGTRCRITYVASSEVPELYRMADVMVHACLEEGFGYAVVEAISAGLMVLVHDTPHFEWLTQDRDCLVDMRVPGKLRDRLKELMLKREDLSSRLQARAATARRRFDWRSLTQEYVELYGKVASLSHSSLVRKGGVA